MAVQADKKIGKKIGKKDDLFCVLIAAEWMAIRCQKGCWRRADKIDGEDRMYLLEKRLIDRYGRPRGVELIERMNMLTYRS